MKKVLIIPLLLTIALMVAGLCLENQAGIIMFVIGLVALLVISQLNKIDW